MLEAPVSTEYVPWFRSASDVLLVQGNVAWRVGTLPALLYPLPPADPLVTN